MRKNIIKTACVTAATALMLGVFATPQTEVFNQTVNTQAKTKKTYYKGKKIKTKKVTKYYTKKQKKQFNLPSRLKSEVYTKYNKQGKIIYKRETNVSLYKNNYKDAKKSSSKHVYTYKNYRSIKDSYTKKTNWTYTNFNTKHYWKKYQYKKFNEINNWTDYYSKKGNLYKQVRYDRKNWTGKKWKKYVSKKNNKGNWKDTYYLAKKGKYKKVSSKKYYNAKLK